MLQQQTEDEGILSVGLTCVSFTDFTEVRAKSSCKLDRSGKPKKPSKKTRIKKHPLAFFKLRGRSFYVSLYRSVCLSNKCQKLSKRGFETTNDCTIEHKEYFNILECTRVHPSIKQALLSLEAAIKEQRISTRFIV